MYCITPNDKKVTLDNALRKLESKGEQITQGDSIVL